MPPFENNEERGVLENLVMIEEKTTLVCKAGSVQIDDSCGKTFIRNYVLFFH